MLLKNKAGYRGKRRYCFSNGGLEGFSRERILEQRLEGGKKAAVNIWVRASWLEGAQVQRSWGGSSHSAFQELQEGQCDWSQEKGMEGGLGRVVRMDRKN